MAQGTVIVEVVDPEALRGLLRAGSAPSAPTSDRLLRVSYAGRSLPVESDVSAHLWLEDVLAAEQSGLSEWEPEADELGLRRLVGPRLTRQLHLLTAGEAGLLVAVSHTRWRATLVSRQPAGVDELALAGAVADWMTSAAAAAG